MVTETLTTALSDIFINPAGLAALAALIPLIIFYLIRKQPEEKVMPSFMFFQDGDDNDSASRAYRRLLRNLVLLMHLLTVVLIALALANPLVDGVGQREHSVIVIDHSASMSGDLDRAKGFAVDRLGRENTIIAVDSDSEVRAERVSDSRAREIINSIELSDTSTDVASALRTARNYDGGLIVASDLDQSSGSGNPESLVEEYAASGNEVQIMETERRNSWGIVDIEVGEGNSSVDVKNFENRENTVTLNHRGEQEVTIEGRSVETVQLESYPGENTVTLEEDDLPVDNEAYFSVPGNSSYEVALIGDRENRYLMKAFELIDFTEPSYYQTPLDSVPEADLYVVGYTDGLLTETSEQLTNRVNSGASLAVFASEGFEDLNIDAVNAEETGDKINESISVAEPVNLDLGTHEIAEIDSAEGERLSRNSDALIRSSYGQGEVLLYNVEDEKFNTEFLYPVFWREISSDMLDRPSIDDINRRTGERINFGSYETPEGGEGEGLFTMRSAGFYSTEEGAVAANLANEDESLRDRVEAESSGTEEVSGRDSVGNYILALLAILLTLETAYLYRIGDMR